MRLLNLGSKIIQNSGMIQKENMLSSKNYENVCFSHKNQRWYIQKLASKRSWKVYHLSKPRGWYVRKLVWSGAETSKAKRPGNIKTRTHSKKGNGRELSNACGAVLERTHVAQVLLEIRRELLRQLRIQLVEVPRTEIFHQWPNRHMSTRIVRGSFSAVSNPMFASE